jgi:hypothetical protein
MAAHVDIRAPRSWGLRTWLKVATHPLELDTRLAAGENPTSCPELARRAYILRGWRVRHRLADGIEKTVVEAVAPPYEHGAAVPVQREEVLTAQHDLLRLIRALRSEPAPPVEAIATVSLLLTNGAGPMFAPHPHGTLSEVVFQAAFHAEAG